MQAVNYTTARNNLKALIDNACDNDEEIIITTKNDKSVNGGVKMGSMKAA